MAGRCFRHVLRGVIALLLALSSMAESNPNSTSLVLRAVVPRQMTVTLTCTGSTRTFQDPANCSRYYLCNNDNFQLLNCAAGLVFSPAAEQCGNYPIVAGCTPAGGGGGPGTVAGGSTSTNSYTCPKPSGNFQDSSNCTRYYACSASVPPVLTDCPAGQWFDPNNELCVDAHDAKNCIVASATVASVDNYQCPASFGLHHDTSDCAWYYDCTHYQPQRVNCPANQFFDPVQESCRANFQPTGCHSVPGTGPTPTTLTTTTSSFTCPAPTGSYQDQSDCRYYWYCVNNQPQRFPCQSNFLFDPTSSMCLNIQYVPNCILRQGSAVAFTCPQPIGNYQDNTDCSKYWSCVNNVASRMTCPANQLFDPTLFGCSSSVQSVAGCTHRGTTQFTCPGVQGNYQDPTDCSKYWRCMNNVPTSVPCPYNQLFDPATFRCSSTVRFVQGCATPGTSAPGQFTCPGVQGNYQDPTDCSKYWRCMNNVPTSVPCPYNQLFDPATFRCSSTVRFVQGCATRGTSALGQFTCPGVQGNYQDPTDCSKYWRCMNNVPTSVPCPYNQLFDPTTFRCSSTVRFVQGCATRGTSAPGQFSCPVAYGNFQDTTNCNKYWYCVNYVPSNLNCAANELFDPRINACSSSVWSVQGCVMPSQTYGGQFVCPQPSGLFQDTTDCNKYYQCINGLPYNYPCPNNQLFDPSMSRCNPNIQYVSGCTRSQYGSPVTAVSTTTIRCPGYSADVQDRDDCSRYFHCNNNYVQPRTCPAGQTFNPTQRICGNFAPHPDCRVVTPGGAWSGTASPRSYVCPRPHGNFQDTSNCRKHYACDNNIARSLECPINQMYYPNSEQCSSSNIAPAGCHLPDTSGQPGNVGDYQCASSHGKYKDSADCSWYYVCDHYIGTRHECESPLLFDPQAKECRESVQPSGCLLTQTQTTTSGVASSSFNCPSPFGSFQDVNDCSKFWSCSFNRATSVPCGPNELFNVAARSCSSSIASVQGCRMPGSGYTDTLGTYVCQVRNGRFQDSTDCSRYYQCTNSIASRQQCPQGQMFDPNAEDCSFNYIPEGCHIPDNFQIGTSGDYQCPTSHGRHQDTSDCAGFYVCNNYRAFRHECPGSQLYDPLNYNCSSSVRPSGCHYIERTGSGSSPGFSATTTSRSFNCPSSFGLYQDQNDCTKYWSCSRNIATSVPCQPNELFDTGTRQCSSTIRYVAGCVMPQMSGSGGTGTPSSSGSGTNYVCQAPNGRFRDTSDCSYFYQCNNNIPQRMRCLGGQVFDPNDQQCSDSHDATGCHEADASQPGQSGQYQCPDAYGTHHDTTDCSRFYICNNFQPRRYQCPAPQLFDPQTEECSSAVVPVGCHRVIRAGSSTGSGSGSVVTQQLFTCPRASGRFQDVENCSRFYNCVNFQPTNYQCEGGRLFDPRIGQCNGAINYVSGCRTPSGR